MAPFKFLPQPASDVHSVVRGIELTPAFRRALTVSLACQAPFSRAANDLPRFTTGGEDRDRTA